MNARIFQGADPSICGLSLEDYSRILNCKPPNGTKITDFWQSMVDLGFTRIYKPTIDKLNGVLDGGDAAILHHGSGNRRHYSLVIKRTETLYYVVNHYCGPTVAKLPNWKFISDVFVEPKLWLVKNPKNL